MPEYRGLIKTTDIDIYELDIKNGDFIVSIDDCIYSGIHMYADVFEQFSDHFDVSNVYAITITPFFSDDGIRSIKDATKDQGYLGFEHFGFDEIKPIIISDDINVLGEKSYFIDMEFESSLLYPIYFDHKIAGTSSSFPNIYLEGRIPSSSTYSYNIKYNHGNMKQYINTGSLLLNLPDRTPINELAEILMDNGLW